MLAKKTDEMPSQENMMKLCLMFKKVLCLNMHEYLLNNV